MDIFEATEKGDIDAVRCCIARNEDVNAKDHDGYTALILASRYGHPDIANLLLRSGCKHPDGFGGWADVNAKDNNGRTALVLTSENGHANTTELLLRSGADVNEKDNDGNTALMGVLRYRYADIARLLLRSGADINEKNDCGDTALILASRYGYIDTLECIVSTAMRNPDVPYATVTLSSFVPRWKDMNARDYAGFVTKVIPVYLECAVGNATFGCDMQWDIIEILGGKVDKDRESPTDQDKTLLAKLLRTLRSIDYTERVKSKNDEKTFQEMEL